MDNPSIDAIEKFLTAFWTALVPKRNRNIFYFCIGSHTWKKDLSDLCDNDTCFCSSIKKQMLNDLSSTDIS